MGSELVTAINLLQRLPTARWVADLMVTARVTAPLRPEKT
jgi:hypothetical protein